jgi:hypothetical protein
MEFPPVVTYICGNYLYIPLASVTPSMRHDGEQHRKEDDQQVGEDCDYVRNQFPHNTLTLRGNLDVIKALRMNP